MSNHKCRKCGIDESSLKMPLTIYGLCNDCHNKFIHYLREAMQKFLNDNEKGVKNGK